MRLAFPVNVAQFSYAGLAAGGFQGTLPICNVDSVAEQAVHTLYSAYLRI